jgi:hypothetical protein
MTSRRQFILIFSHPRSGSTTLAQALNWHPEVRIIEEPFAERKVGSLAELDEALHALVRPPWSGTGIKHVYNYKWPFLSDRAHEYNRHLLLRADWIPVLLWRRNLFDAALSDAIARQLNAWDTETSRRLLGGAVSLAPVPVYRIRKHISAMERDISTYRGYLIDARKPYVEITYEELYGDRVSPDERIAIVNEIIRAAGYRELADDKTIGAVRQLLSSDNKLNNKATYELVPNIEELILAFSEFVGSPS